MFGAVVGWPATVLAAFGLLLRHLDTGHQVLIVLASAAYVFVPFSLLGLALHLWRRAWVAVVVGTLVVVLQVVAYAPVLVADSPPPAAATLHVYTQNLLYGRADAEKLVNRIEAASTDVFLAQELTPTSVTALREAGLDDRLPYSFLDPRRDAGGTGIWSRYPVSDTRRLIPEGLPGVVAVVAVPGAGDVVASSVHPASPFPGDPSDWYTQLGRLKAVLAADRRPALVGGDFNATLDHARFRALLVDGWRDGAEQAGAGWQRTWPSNRRSPALVGIDHVLTLGTVATAVGSAPVRGSDHRGLVATVVVPR